MSSPHGFWNVGDDAPVGQSSQLRRPEGVEQHRARDARFAAAHRGDGIPPQHQQGSFIPDSVMTPEQIALYEHQKRQAADLFGGYGEQIEQLSQLEGVRQMRLYQLMGSLERSGMTADQIQGRMDGITSLQNQIERLVGISYARGIPPEGHDERCYGSIQDIRCISRNDMNESLRHVHLNSVDRSKFDSLKDLVVKRFDNSNDFVGRWLEMVMDYKKCNNSDLMTIMQNIVTTCKIRRASSMPSFSLE